MTAIDRPRLLVTADEFHASLALVRGLAEGGYRLVLAVSRSDTFAARSRAVGEVVRVPSEELDPEAFAAAVAKIGAERDVACVLPGSEAALLALARHRRHLTVPLAAPVSERVELAVDKARMLRLARECGVIVPESRAGSEEELSAQAEQVEYPAVLKATRSRVSVADGRLVPAQARKVHTALELRQALTELPNATWLLEPWLPGELVAVGGVAHEGEVLATVHQRAVRTWPPEMGFSCFAQATSREPELEHSVRRVIARLGWSGLFQLQLIRDADGVPRAIDFNPRAYGSLALALAAGVNLPAMWAASALGQAPPPARYQPGALYRWTPGDLRNFIWLARNGELHRALDVLRPRRHTTNAILALRDPAPTVELASRLVRRLRAR